MWTEFISKLPHLQYMLMPRIDALSEICWTQDSLKNFNDFEKRMNTQYLRYDAMNINYRIPTPIINDTIYLKKNNKIIIKNPSNCTTIRYTLDGSNPTTSSNKYSKPLIIKQNCILKSACFNKKNRRSSIVTSHIIVH
jgi:hexosaminidase